MEIKMNELKEKYIDYTVDQMDLDILLDFVKDELNVRYHAMSHSEFIDMVKDVDPDFFIEELANG